MTEFFIERPVRDGPTGRHVSRGTEPGSAPPSTSVSAPPLGVKMTRALRVIVAVQMIAVMAFGSITIMKYPLWSLVDEGAHFDNIAYIAQHGSLPVLGHALATEQELAIAEGLDPTHASIDPRKHGLGGLAYEAFQPPLYYYLATPAFFLSSDYHTKAIILRFFGLGLFVVAIALLARLSRHVLKRRWLIGLAGGMLIFLMPGVMVRAVTISDVNLAVPIAIATVTELWIAWERRSSYRVITAGLLVGCGVLTDLYLAEMVPIFIVVAVITMVGNVSRAHRIRCVAGVALAAAVTVPWFVFNEIHYKALTASNLAKKEQLSTVNRHHLHFGLSEIPGLTVQTLFAPLMPQEWSTWLTGHDLLVYGATLFEVCIVPAAIVLAVALWRRTLQSGYWILILPWLCNIALCWYIDYGQQWQSGAMVARYTYPTLVILGLFTAAAASVFIRSNRTWLVTLITGTAFLIVLWGHLVPSIHDTLVA
ncbi:MAG TPA: hypothetical protein VGH31_10450 [Acidimicrobiales bacterium]